MVPLLSWVWWLIDASTLEDTKAQLLVILSEQYQLETGQSGPHFLKETLDQQLCPLKYAPMSTRVSAKSFFQHLNDERPSKLKVLH